MFPNHLRSTRPQAGQRGYYGRDGHSSLNVETGDAIDDRLASRVTESL
ncbi:MAG: hypothetical protein CM1200mP9_05790 [Gammaproteobacteria bacterium]|nr:MAG: hypothetical protein CM1200mP9_05790 [Gammaproteobacteria bacterium]